MSEKEHVLMNFPEFIEVLERVGYRIASAVKPLGAAPGHDATGGAVDSLTEAVMGVTAGLVRVADAMGNIAEAIRESHSW